MDLSEIISVCVLYSIIGVGLVLSLPTFGSEFVHIKVHIPHESSSAADVLTSIHPVIYNFPKNHVNRKIVYHYRRPGSPIKKLPNKETDPLLENLYLAELDKFQSSDSLHQPNYIENQFHDKKHKNEISTVKLKEEYEHQPCLEHCENHVETAKLIESDNRHYKDLDQHVKTVKIVEEKPQYQFQQEKYVDYDYVHKPHLEQEQNIQDQLLDEKSLKFAKTKQVQNENHYQIQYDFLKPKKQELAKSHEEYNLFRNIPQSHYHYGQEPIVSNEEDIEYKQAEKIHHYLQKEIQNVKYASFAAESIQHYDTHSVIEPHVSTNIDNEDNSENNQHKYLTDYKKLFPSSGISQNCNESSLEDYSLNNEANLNAAETYTGHDSYSAGHVQGLDSGGYRCHMP